MDTNEIMMVDGYGTKPFDGAKKSRKGKKGKKKKGKPSRAARICGKDANKGCKKAVAKLIVRANKKCPR